MKGWILMQNEHRYQDSSVVELWARNYENLGLDLGILVRTASGGEDELPTLILAQILKQASLGSGILISTHWRWSMLSLDLWKYISLSQQLHLQAIFIMNPSKFSAGQRWGNWEAKRTGAVYKMWWKSHKFIRPDSPQRWAFQTQDWISSELRNLYPLCARWSRLLSQCVLNVRHNPLKLLTNSSYAITSETLTLPDWRRQLQQF